MEHVEVLRDLRDIARAAIGAGDWKVDGACDPDAALRRADAAIASLSAPKPEGEWVLVRRSAIESAIETLENDGDEHGEGRNLRAAIDEAAAPQPPAEAQPVASDVPTAAEWLERAKAEATSDFLEGWDYCREKYPMRNPTPSAPVGVEVTALIANMAAYLRAEGSENASPLIQHADRILAQQPAAVDGDWRKKAAEWLEAKAVEQEAANQKWPSHAACYKEWRDRPGILRHLAIQVLAAQSGGSDNDR